MDKASLFFHIARQAGLEFVFSSGRALTYPSHTHVSAFTLTLVRGGTVCLDRSGVRRTHHSGEVYVVVPHEPHSPIYGDGFDIVSLCVHKDRIRDMSLPALQSLCADYAASLVSQRLLRPEDVRALCYGLQWLYAARSAGRGQPEPLHAAKGAGSPTLSPFQRIRRSKAETGLTPHQFLVQSRLRKAKRLLTEGLALADVADLAGFYDQSHLNRWFNRHLGITPRAYRDSCRFLDG